MSVEKFIDGLRNCPEGHLFNPWWQRDEENDDYTNAPEIRRQQLSCYLRERLGRTKYLLIGEALGYQGGHFSGIAMTSERMLLGNLCNRGIEPEHVFTLMQPARTSREELRNGGFSEPTATIVWGHLLGAGIDPYEFAIWNALPWHPYSADKGMLSNRTPSQNELNSGHAHLLKLIDILNPQAFVAVGEKAAIQLELLNLKHTKVRHPANGGAGKFREQFSLIAKGHKT